SRPDFRCIPDRDRHVMTDAAAFALRLRHFQDLPLDPFQPAVDVLLVRRSHDRLAVPADERENLDANLHGLLLLRFPHGSSHGSHRRNAISASLVSFGFSCWIQCPHLSSRTTGRKLGTRSAMCSTAAWKPGNSRTGSSLPPMNSAGGRVLTSANGASNSQ